MTLPKIIVEIELRFDAGPDSPRNRQLMARVRQRDAEGDVYGRCLLAHSYIIDLTQAMNICRHKLHRTGAMISFEFGPRLQRASMRCAESKTA
jgi:hypothetical protein